MKQTAVTKRDPIAFIWICTAAILALNFCLHALVG